MYKSLVELHTAMHPTLFTCFLFIHMYMYDNDNVADDMTYMILFRLVDAYCYESYHLLE